MTATERPILFSGPMVRAILGDRKTETRRVVRSPERLDGLMLVGEEPDWCPYGAPGDTLWVRETWRRSPNDLPDGIQYRADNLLRWFDGSEIAREDRLRAECLPRDGRWSPSIHMPKWACRLRLRVEEVRVERLQEIDDLGAIAEGASKRDGARLLWSMDWSRLGQRSRFAPTGRLEPSDIGFSSPRAAFGNGWDSINGKRAPWASNPWVWVIRFARTDTP